MTVTDPQTHDHSAPTRRGRGGRVPHPPRHRRDPPRQRIRCRRRSCRRRDRRSARDRTSPRSRDHGREDAQLDGISAAEHLSKNHIAPVVLLTAFSQKDLVERASEAGALAYVVKPFTPNDLLPAMRSPWPATSRSSLSRPRSPTWSSASRPQARRPRQGPPEREDGPNGARGVPLDPEGIHGSPPHHARRRSGHHRAAGPRRVPTHTAANRCATRRNRRAWHLDPGSRARSQVRDHVRDPHRRETFALFVADRDLVNGELRPR